MMVPEYKAYYKNLGQNISFYRRRRDMSQEVLAEIVDVHNRSEERRVGKER